MTDMAFNDEFPTDSEIRIAQNFADVANALLESQARVKELESQLHEKTQSVAGLLNLAGALRDKIDEVKRSHPGPFDA